MARAMLQYRGNQGLVEALVWVAKSGGPAVELDRMGVFTKSTVCAVTFAVALALAGTGAALADPPPAPAGDERACVAALPPLALRIYNAVKPTLKPGDDLRTAIRAVVKPWVMNGEIKRDDARPAAQAAGHCLKMGM